MNWQDEKTQLQKLIGASEAALIQIARDAGGPDDDEAAMNYVSEAGRLAFMRARLAHIGTVADDEAAQLQAHAQRVQDALQPALDALNTELNYWKGCRRDAMYRLQQANPYASNDKLRSEIETATGRVNELTAIADTLPQDAGQIDAAINDARQWLACLNDVRLPAMNGTIDTQRIYDAHSARHARALAWLRACEDSAGALQALGVAVQGV